MASDAIGETAGSAVEESAGVKFGLFLNTSGWPGLSHADVFGLTLRQAELAEELGFYDAWISEHHFSPFGYNPDALSAAGFLLGRTRRLRVGTAVTVVPEHHPVRLAEHAAILDQLSLGRLQFGLGRGGYAVNYDVFGFDPARRDVEVGATVALLLDAWQAGEVASDSPFHPFPAVRVHPESWTRPHPPLYVASHDAANIEVAAQHGFPLLHYFGLPKEVLVEAEDRYAEAAHRHGRDPSGVEHVHAAICVVDDDEGRARATVAAAIRHLYTIERKTGPVRRLPAEATFVDIDRLAETAIDRAIVGPPRTVAAGIEEYLRRSQARRLTLFMEVAMRPQAIETSIRRFAAEVAPMISAAHRAASAAASG